VADEHAGRQVKCPVCNDVTKAPNPDPGFEVIEDSSALTSPPPPPPKPAITRARPVEVADEDDEPPKKRRSDQNGDDERPRNKKHDNDDEDDEDERPWKKKGQVKSAQKAHNFRMEHRILNGGVLGGLAAMLIAVVWFVVGLINDIIFFYPPVLFVLGLIAMIKGAIGSDTEE
jgi:hypothetical protein